MSDLKQRIVCWFSCGAASAVATKLAIAENGGKHPLVIAYTRVSEEHPDNTRFMRDCEQWFGQEITVLENEKYHASINEVFSREKYMAGIMGAPCTRLLKREVRQKFQQPDDIHVFGYTAEEQHRVDRFIDANNDAEIWAILVEKGLTKEDCLAMIDRAGIRLPEMYRMGYRNNNCIGCVKGGAGYWNKIRKDFPDVFRLRCEQSRKLNAKIVTMNGKHIFLDELPETAGNYQAEPSFQCGIMCELAEKEMQCKN